MVETKLSVLVSDTNTGKQRCLCTYYVHMCRAFIIIIIYYYYYYYYLFVHTNTGTKIVIKK